MRGDPNLVYVRIIRVRHTSVHWYDKNAWCYQGILWRLENCTVTLYKLIALSLPAEAKFKMETKLSNFHFVKCRAQSSIAQNSIARKTYQIAFISMVTHFGFTQTLKLDRELEHHSSEGFELALTTSQWNYLLSLATNLSSDLNLKLVRTF